MKLLLFAQALIATLLVSVCLLLFSLGSQLQRIADLQQRQYDLMSRWQAQTVDEFNNLHMKQDATKPLTKHK